MNIAMAYTNALRVAIKQTEKMLARHAWVHIHGSSYWNVFRRSSLPLAPMRCFDLRKEMSTNGWFPLTGDSCSRSAKR